MPEVQSEQIKPTSDWKAAEPMTSRQRWFLTKLVERAGVPMRDDLTKAEASKLIDELQAKIKPQSSAA